MRKICVIGLGYVGLPLAAEFAKKFSVVGFDVSEKRVFELKQGVDKTLELSKEKLKEAFENSFSLTSSLADISECDFFVVCVPTPVDRHQRPDLSPLILASKLIAKVLKKGDIVVYESTVYPGATQEVCVPILESESGLKFNDEFFCGYSPERINPGDKLHTVDKILKITSGSTPLAADIIDEVYASIITAGTYKASSIKVAEAAKVIENTQRDINIAFVNELAMLFNRLGIDTNEVLDAAATKWNFLNFRPGLVGGHCIGVDPYYLTHKAKEVGYHAEMILAGRKINDNMGVYVASQCVKMMIKEGINIKSSKILILGMTFKENCPDIRNSRVVDVINELKEFKADVSVYDPWADREAAKKFYSIELLDECVISEFDCVLIAVAHDEFKKMDFGATLVYDIKNICKSASTRL